MADKYVLVENHRDKFVSGPIQSDEVRLTALGKRRNYVSYAISKLTGVRADGVPSAEDAIPPVPMRTIHLRSMGRACDKAVAVAEIVKRRVVGLHQITKVTSLEVNDVFEPTEEGLKTVIIPRRVTSIEITLSKDVLDTSDPGYQPPISESEVTPERPGGPASNQRRGRGGKGFPRRSFDDRKATHDFAASSSSSSKPTPTAIADSNDQQQSSRSTRGKFSRGGASRGRGGRGGSNVPRGSSAPRGRGGRGGSRGRGAANQQQ